MKIESRDGVDVFKVIESEDVTDHAASYRVETPSGRSFTFEDGRGSRNWESKRKRALAWAELRRRIPGLEFTSGPDVVPLQIARRGNAVIAAYLFAAHALPSDRIAEELDVGRETVKQYVNDVVTRRR